MTREATVGPAPEVTRASGEDHAGGDVVMRETRTVEVTRTQRGWTADKGSQRRGNHVKTEMSGNHRTARSDEDPWERRRLANKLWLSPREALDRSREITRGSKMLRTMR